MARAYCLTCDHKCHCVESGYYPNTTECGCGCFTCTCTGLPSFTVKDNIPDWKVQTSEWNVEDTRKWRTEDTDNFFYEIEEKK